jgi:transposase
MVLRVSAFAPAALLCSLLLSPVAGRARRGKALRLRLLDDLDGSTTSGSRAFAYQDERCRRLVKVEGVGPLVATAMVATIGNARQFTNGRELDAWLGLVPREHSSGNRTLCSASANAAIVICARCLSTGHARPSAWPSANATRVVSG